MVIRRVDQTSSVPSSEGAKKPNKNAATAAKVAQIAQFPALGQKGLQGRSISRLEQAKNLYKSLRKDWDNLSPEELAEQIIDLESRVSEFTESSPTVDKIKKQVEHLHFQFVFPIVLELQEGSQSFAATVHKLAQKVLKTQSIHPFNQLSEPQQREVRQIASRSST